MIFPATISHIIRRYFSDSTIKNAKLDKVNELLQRTTGIVTFFENNGELTDFRSYLFSQETTFNEQDKVEYGDFQTNPTLADSVVKHLIKSKVDPDVVIEPTCGVGNFIIAAVKNFHNLKWVYGVEIYKPYLWETKFAILDFYLNCPVEIKPEIRLVHTSVFDYDFNRIADKHATANILVLGNPPWVTNSKLSSLNSNNLPVKSNFKNHNGFDAITGKSNFDIAEYITLMMFDTFQHINGHLAFLVKNSVVKNIVSDQEGKQYRISHLEKFIIDSKKEFDASVDAALFSCRLNDVPAFLCDEYDFYNNSKKVKRFGWIASKFVSNVEDYMASNRIDGECPFVWRQGVKHDCSAVMELSKEGKHYTNRLGETIDLEGKLVYGLIKSSDLKDTVIDTTRRYTIVTQQKVGQETNYIKTSLPKTYHYLSKHQDSFDARKSSIYKNKPAFSIFGIGDYSFKPYKVAISGLYKTFHFSLVLPLDGKPVMLDDTCYFIGFDNLEDALYSLILLNSDLTKRLLQAITFPDAKRTFTKDILMRIDLNALKNLIAKSEIEKQVEILNARYDFEVNATNYDGFLSSIYLSPQPVLF